MWSETWDTHEQRERLLAIDTAPDPESANLLTLDAGVGELLAWLDPLGPERPPELAGWLSAKELAWRAWLEYTGETNPYEPGTPGYEEWDRVWSRLSKNSGAWEGYPAFSAARVALEFDTSIAAAAKSPRAAGLASLLCGVWIDSNPFPQGSWAADDWEEGWLKGVWIKGFLARKYGKELDHLDRLRDAATAAGIRWPFHPESKEGLAWSEGWKTERRAEWREIARALGKQGAPGDPPGLEDPRDLEAWWLGFGEGSAQRSVEQAESLGYRAFRGHGSYRANPYAEGQVEHARWIEGWESGYKQYLADCEIEFEYPSREERRTYGAFGMKSPERQDQIDADLLGDGRPLPPLPPLPEIAEGWPRMWEMLRQDRYQEEAYWTLNPPITEDPFDINPLAREPEPADLTQLPDLEMRKLAHSAGYASRSYDMTDDFNPYSGQSIWEMAMNWYWHMGWSDACVWKPLPEPERAEVPEERPAEKEPSDPSNDWDSF